jgi:hypothetical protein
VQGLYDATPLSPIWVGLAIALLLVAVFLAVEIAFGRMARLEDSYVLHPFVLFFLHVPPLAYLPTAIAYVTRGFRQTTLELRPFLDYSEQEWEQLERQVASHDPRVLRAAGLLGLLILVLPALDYWDPRFWAPEVAFCRIGSLGIAWFGCRFLYIVFEESRRLSKVADRLSTLDLFDLRPFFPFVRRGLSNAFLAAGFFVVISPFVVNAQSHGAVVLIGLGTTATASAGLLLPLIGVRDRIRREKLSKLAWWRDAFREVQANFERNAAAPEQRRLADLVAYRQVIESVREWPFDTSVLIRFGLYLLLPLLSWSGAALVERMIDRWLG